jgi:nitroimidazol reductase NimA-like FMN-containing flavoprotein (pyridoxamine 5'-phosphate oxidase superfamily)
MVIDRNGLDVLSVDECFELLSLAHVGRIALSIGALPVILPVNFHLLDDDVVVRSAPGTKMDAAVSHTVVAFEADAFSPMDHTGWSVLVQGLADEISDPSELRRASALPLRAWASDCVNRFIRIRSQEISGRRLARRAEPLAAAIREER